MDTTELADRLAIAETLALYCRGIDRCDPEQLAAAFTPDAVIDYGDGARPIRAVIPGLMSGLGSMRLTQHNISNTVMRIVGDRAKVETNCVALHIIPSPEGETDLVVGGRYLDTLVRHEGRWLIAERLYVMDWNRSAPATMALEGGLLGGLKRRGARGAEDPSAGWWAEA
ncbi:nuclear transport factor 2 family protein [Erythrobacter sp. NE805]|uniref:nuclear transport factor 2 family protein n=1 Tax=Erythrobacter sp. NE805 TaxID=3389875 RepID=UPI00396B2DDB